jgi:hypothetical protein
MSADHNTIERRQVKSSCISNVGYCPIDQVLEVEFRSGALYRYLDVPEGVHAALITANSKGAYLNRFIKGRFVHERLETKSDAVVLGSAVIRPATRVDDGGQDCGGIALIRCQASGFDRHQPAPEGRGLGNIGRRRRSDPWRRARCARRCSPSSVKWHSASKFDKS